MQVFDPKNNEIKQKKKKFYFNAQKHYIDCQKDIVGKVKTTKKKIKWIKKTIKGKKGTKGRTNKVKILREIKKKEYYLGIAILIATFMGAMTNFKKT